MEQVINGMAEKIDDLSKYCQDNKDRIIYLNDMDRILLNRIEVLENRIKYLEKVDKSYKSDIDDLEAKNDLLRMELDSVYDVLNMDASDIKALQDEIFEGYTRKQTGVNNNE